MKDPTEARSSDEWTVPAELERSAPRPVALSRKGRLVFHLALASAFVAVGSGIGLGSVAARGEAASRSGVPPVMPVVISTEFGVISFVLFWQVLRQRRLLAEGRVSRGVVTGHGRIRRNSHGREVGRNFTYRFTLLSGAEAEGKGGPEKIPPPVGGSIAVIYDRDNPHRNVPYPMSLVQPRAN